MSLLTAFGTDMSGHSAFAMWESSIGAILNDVVAFSFGNSKYREQNQKLSSNVASWRQIISAFVAKAIRGVGIVD